MGSYFLTELKFRIRSIWRRWAKPAAQCLIALIISIGALLLFPSTDGQKLDLWVMKHFYQIRGPLPAPDDVIIVAIDDETYVRLGASPRWPFPRSATATGLEKIVDGKPRVLILDANIPKEDRDTDADARLEAALRAGPTTIWTGQTPTGMPGETPDSEHFVTSGSDPRFEKAAKMQLPMLMGGIGGRLCLMMFTERQADEIYAASPVPRPENEFFARVPVARALVELGDYILTAPGETDFIKFYGPEPTVKRVSLHKVLEPGFDNKIFTNKVVFLGYQSVGRGRGQIDKDEYLTPVSDDPMFGVEIHAHLVGNLLDRGWLSRLKAVDEFCVIYVVALVISIIGVGLPPEKGIPAIIGITVGGMAFLYWRFVTANFWLGGIGALLIAATVAAFGSALYHYVLIKSFRKFIQSRFKFDIEGQ